MKRTFYICIASLTLCFGALFSCREEITSSNQFAETPLVYALLDPNDTIHYVKINRAFIGPGNSYDIAKIADSSYYTTSSCIITEKSGNTTLRTWTLRDTILQTKETGLFAAPEVRLKYFKTTVASPLITDKTYKLDLNIENGKYKVSGSTAMVQGLGVTTSTNNSPFTFINGAGAYSNPSVAYNKGDAAVIDARLRIKIREYKSNGDSLTTVFDMKIDERTTADITGISNSVNAKGETFYQTIANSITNDPTIIRRVLLNTDVVITGGSSDFYSYITVSKPSTSLAQTKPVYTNLTCINSSGASSRVVGIFSSRTTFIAIKAAWKVNPSNVNSPFRGIDKNSMKELAIGQFTGTKLFCSTCIIDIAELWHCP
jgi:hypothetical protein